MVMHTFWGGEINKPLAMILEYRWEEKYHDRLEIFPENDTISFLLPHKVSAENILLLLENIDLEERLRKKLEGSGFFGARFRECAGRAILITKNIARNRMSLWMSRLKSKKLMASVLQYNDFPLLLETWRTCLQDELDIVNLKMILNELKEGIITYSEVRTAFPRPMALTVTWEQIDKYMYMDDKLSTEKNSQLRYDRLSDMVFTPGLRPQISGKIIEKFELKKKRLYTGYSPSSSRDLLDWIKERVLIPQDEWELLLSSIEKDHQLKINEILSEVKSKIVTIYPKNGCKPLIASFEILDKIIHGFCSNHSDLKIQNLVSCDSIHIYSNGKNNDELSAILLGEWLQFYGPIQIKFIKDTLHLKTLQIESCLNNLSEDQKIISGELIKKVKGEFICDCGNYEILLSLSRKAFQPSFQLFDIKYLQFFLSMNQKLSDTSNSMDGLLNIVEQMICYRANAELWESEIFSSRIGSYKSRYLDTIIQESDLLWIGSEKKKLAFCFESDLDLFYDEQSSMEGDKNEKDIDCHSDTIFPDVFGRYNFMSLMSISNLNSSELSDQLWNEVWKGNITNDTFMSIRKGLDNNFKIADTKVKNIRYRSRIHNRRNGFSRWKNSVPFSGNWFYIQKPKQDNDLLEIKEKKKDRTRILLNRYGILFRELLAKEIAPFSWKNIFRTLRIMEFSGEVLSGYFFNGISGPQFITPDVIKYLDTIKNMLYRKFMPLNKITIRKINNKKPVKNEYIKQLRSIFDVIVDYNTITIFKKIEK